VFRSSALVEILAILAPPVSYLDFETFNPAIPLYPNTSPYERIPFEWSLHHDDGSDVLTHAEFLADGQIDPRRDFTETLLIAVERLLGPVIVWSSFEAVIIRELAGLFPDLGDRLAEALDRIVDLLPIVRNHVVHPDFHGSYSMKSVAPALAPEIVYGGDITQGSDASAAFYRIVTDRTLTPETRAEWRRALLKYCANDTLGLARVHQWLNSND
jgi:predicted RecB family nuclease